VLDRAHLQPDLFVPARCSHNDCKVEIWRSIRALSQTLGYRQNSRPEPANCSSAPREYTQRCTPRGGILAHTQSPLDKPSIRASCSHNGQLCNSFQKYIQLLKHKVQFQIASRQNPKQSAKLGIQSTKYTVAPIASLQCLYECEGTGSNVPLHMLSSTVTHILDPLRRYL
jgi:hypothetical protein